MVESRLLFDTASALFLFFTALLGAYVPRYLDQKGTAVPNSATSLAFHLGNMLSGGVMLSAGFCHLLADSLRKLSFIGRFPITPFLAATGYLITLLADQIVQMLTEEQPSHHGGQQQQYQQVPLDDHHHQLAYQHYHQMNLSHQEGNSAIKGTGGRGISSGLLKGSKLLQQGSNSQLELSARAVTSNGAPGHDSIPSSGPALHADELRLLPLHHERSNGISSIHQRSPRATGTGGSHHHHHQQQQQHGDRWGEGGGWDSSGDEGCHRGSCGGGSTCPHSQHPEACTQARAVGRIASQVELEVGSHNHHVHFQVLLSHKKLSFATAVLLAAALCIHSILEGIALGAQQNMRDTQDIMLAIAAHKGLAAYALGASIVESKASAAKFWTVIGLFSCATPLGIAIGFAFSEMGPGAVAAAMSALASGTFLYVAMMEVIPKELEDPSHRGLKMVSLLLGFGAMSLLAVWA